MYEVATQVPVGDAVIVGYGVSSAGLPQTGSGTQREGLVSITSVDGVNIYITGRKTGTYQNACNGDSGGPIFIPGQDGLVVGGVTSRGGLFCPANSEGIYTSAVQQTNLESITEVTREWLGEPSAVVPGRCPVTECCYDMVCESSSHHHHHKK